MDTADTTVTPDAVEQPPSADPLAGLLGGAMPDMGAMLGLLGIEMPSPDDPTMAELGDAVELLTRKVDWLADALGKAVAMAPGRFAPDLAPYPSSLDDD